MLETVDKYGGSLNALEAYKRKTNQLEDYIIDIRDQIQNNSNARNAISKDLETFKSVCVAEQGNLTTEIKKINYLQEQQQEVSKKLDTFVHDLDAKKNSTSQNLNIVQENCIAEQRELKTKVQKLDTVVKVQNDTKSKLQSLSTKIEEQKTTNTQSLESFQNSISTEQNQVRKELQKIVPLTKTQDETAKKLDNLISSLNQLKNGQQTLEKNLKQLSDQFEAFVRGHTPPPTTLAPTTPTPDPNNQPVIIRKHIHARGNNIVVTI